MSEQPPSHTELLPELRYLALGDSYTIGEAVAEDGRWPMQLARLLRSEGIALADPRIIATTGWTTDELDAAIQAQEPLGDHDFVSLLIGVNNQYRGRSGLRRSPAGGVRAAGRRAPRPCTAMRRDAGHLPPASWRTDCHGSIW